MTTEKNIISSRLFSQANGTNKYKVYWEGDWSEEELINHCDGGAYNYGGRVDCMEEIGEGTYRGIVCVYYD